MPSATDEWPTRAHSAEFKTRFIPTVCYAAGLRISEAVRLTLTAIDSQRMVIRVEQGKGRKDRSVMLSAQLLDAPVATGA
jgi:site-specific recombinase XerD